MLLSGHTLELFNLLSPKSQRLSLRWGGMRPGGCGGRGGGSALHFQGGARAGGKDVSRGCGSVEVEDSRRILELDEPSALSLDHPSNPLSAAGAAAPSGHGSQRQQRDLEFVWTKV